MWLLLFAWLGAAVPPVPRQDPGATAVRTLEPEFNALLLKYGAAVREYDDLRVRRAREQSTDKGPPHPARQFFAEFMALAGKDSGGAQGWVIENLADALDDPAERARVAKEIFPKLVAKHADEDSALHAIDGIKRIAADLGEATVMDMARALEQQSHTPGVKGAAMLLEAWSRSQGGAATDPERWKDTMEIYRSVLYTLPNTRAGKEAAGYLIGPLETRFYEAERKWVDAVIALQAAGKPAEEWPRQPIHDFAPEYQPIALAAHHTAAQWVNKFHPAYVQAEVQGLPFAYQWLAITLGEYYADGNGPWNVLRMDLLAALYRQYPNERWVLSSLRKLLTFIEAVPVEPIAPALQTLLDKNTDPRARPLAMFALAQCAKSHGDQRGYEQAIALFTRIRDEFPQGELREAAESGRADLARCMPGQPAPSKPAPDTDGRSFSVADYKGRVVMLEFWTFDVPACLEAVPSRAALADELAKKPFSLVGVNLDRLKPQPFLARAGAAGIRWRTALAQFQHPVTEGWELRRYPTTILIDKKGIIRARDLPWNEMVALAKQLVDES
jgi:thiol-disulfide isomerase/thioredoxin